MNRLFTITIQKEEGWYVAKCPENSVASQGQTIDEAIDNLREALELYYEDEALPAAPHEIHLIAEGHTGLSRQMDDLSNRMERVENKLDEAVVVKVAGKV